MTEPIPLLFQALQFVATKHAGQYRKGGRRIPYINHPIGVATLLATVGGVTDDPLSSNRKHAQETEAPFKSQSAKLIRIADKTCNVRDITNAPPPSWDDERRLAYFEWAARVIAGMRGVHPGLEADFDAMVERGRAMASPIAPPIGR